MFFFFFFFCFFLEKGVWLSFNWFNAIPRLLPSLSGPTDGDNDGNGKALRLITVRESGDGGVVAFYAKPRAYSLSHLLIKKTFCKHLSVDVFQAKTRINKGGGKRQIPFIKVTICFLFFPFSFSFFSALLSFATNLWFSLTHFHPTRNWALRSFVLVLLLFFSE